MAELMDLSKSPQPAEERRYPDAVTVYLAGIFVGLTVGERLVRGVLGVFVEHFIEGVRL